MKVQVYNNKAEKVSTVQVPKPIAEARWNADLVHQVVEAFLANRRSATAKVKGRGEVRGGGKKPWRQKGTGRARHGSIRSPIWIGGGVTHGPTAEKRYAKKINKKMSRKALYMVLAKKVQDDEMIALDTLSFNEEKTRTAAGFLKQFEAANIIEPGKSKIILTEPGQIEIVRSFRNIPRVTIMEARNLNAVQALRGKYIFCSKKTFHGIV